MEDIAPTDRSRLRRLPARGAYDRTSIHAILDEAPICHVGFVVDGQPFVIPTIHVRIGESLYFHGSPASRMLRTMAQGIDVCVTVTIVDGLVLARSAFHHSMNYRSVVIFGTARPVEGLDDRRDVLHALSDHLIKGRWEEVRPPTPAELKQTLVLSLPINEASAKVRTGPPRDDEEDYSLPVWAGVLPLSLTPAAPVADERLLAGTKPPDHVQRYAGPGTARPESDA
jgi:nitroimidazol reductase NimA-like FMN-containing flavoprotein (pyridoxamine 5'-phosphate oxidase superfamily)